MQSYRGRMTSLVPWQGPHTKSRHHFWNARLLVHRSQTTRRYSTPDNVRADPKQASLAGNLVSFYNDSWAWQLDSLLGEVRSVSADKLETLYKIRVKSQEKRPQVTMSYLSSCGFVRLEIIAQSTHFRHEVHRRHPSSIQR